MRRTNSLATVNRGAAICVSVLLAAAIAGCASPGLKQEIYRPPPTYALAPATDGILADLASGFIGEGEESGFMLLDTSYDGLLWRLALIDSAVSSLDILTYLWYPDNSGRLILERAVLAAQRGVQVRLVIDDLMTAGQDQLMANIENQPNIELRLFNPWKGRSTMSRAGEMIAEMERLNSRMHDKLVIADGNAAIVGGRNIGDHYFGLHETYNFHDLDLFGAGHLAVQANDMFDHFWNSELLVSAQNLTTDPDDEIARQAWQTVRAKNREAPELAAFNAHDMDWTAEIEELRETLHPGTSEIIFDRIDGSTIDQSMIGSMFAFFDRAQEELYITNAYLIPGQNGMDFLKSLTDRGVDVNILTNSLASHDVPAVNSHYEPWRDDIIRTGAKLFEFRADAAIAEIIDVPPVQGDFVGLHTKAAVADQRFVFIGSMNLDPRSANINTEMGAIVESPGLGRGTDNTDATRHERGECVAGNDRTITASCCGRNSDEIGR